MRPFLLQTAEELDRQRPPDDQELVHFTESLATTVIEEHTRAGDRVLDPFAGFGTTLVVAERLQRTAVGVELLPERVHTIEQRLGPKAQVLPGDARALESLVRGPFDLCLTSPPYRTANDHPENPLDAYETLTGDYGSYLAELGQVFHAVARLLRPGGHAVLNVANVVHHGVLTPLAWDVARVVSRHLTLLHETFLCWDRQPPGITGDYLLVFARPT